MKPTTEEIQEAINSLTKEMESIRQQEKSLRVKAEKIKTLLDKKNILLIALENFKRGY